MREITVNTQSSIKIDNIYFDPFKISSETHDASIIFITHSHYDHFDLDSINKVKNDKTIFIIPDDDNIKSKLDNYQVVYPNTKYNINNLVIETIPSYNLNKPFHPKDNNWLGYLITLDNETYYIMGDTDINDDNLIIKCDYLFIPIGGTYTMNYKEAANLIKEIKPKYAIPTHYKTVVGNIKDAYKFKELLNETTEVRIMME